MSSVRPDIWTRKLSFEGGAVLETTDEHPLYVEGSGFAKAKEVGIGSSIVTRAGPGAKVVAVQADVRQTTVYNFTVDEFHTYFVGQDALWAHNQNCSEFVKNLNTRPPASGANPAARQYQIDQVGDVEFHIGGAGNEIWADGLRVNANTNTITALESKFVGTPNSSPYIPGSGCPDFIRQNVRNQLDLEFVRYKAAIDDAANPISELEIITNDARAVTYFQTLMSNHNIVGRVLLRP